MRLCRPVLVCLLVLLSACSKPGGTPDASEETADAGLSDAGGGDGGWADAGAAQLEADLATQSFLLHFWNPSPGYLANNYPKGDGGETGYWTFAEGLDAVVDAVERTHGQNYAGLIQTFYLAQSARGWTDDFFDDESWMALALIHAYDVTGEASYLVEARQLYTDIMDNGWDVTCCGSDPGGIWWRRNPTTNKVTASNAGPVIAGVRLAQRVQDPSYLAFAEKVYAHWKGQAIGPNGQVADHVNPDGSLVFWKYTYNDGLMLGAALALHQATGAPSYLQDAWSRAHFMLANETVKTALGDVLSDGSSCSGDCNAFKGIAYRYLALLQAADPGEAELQSTLSASAESIWQLARDPSTTLFATSWVGPPSPTSLENQDVSAVMALNLAAESLGAPPQSGRPANDMQAEDGILRGVGMEAFYGSFEGWGYLAGWNGVGQGVDLSFVAPDAASYTFSFRYAAGAGAATRSLSLDGTVVQASQAFAATGSWSSYATATSTQTLAAGSHVLSIDFGSNYLNLDSVTWAPSCSGQPPPTPQPLGPANGASSCNGPQLCWQTSPGSSYDLVVDGQVACSTSAGCCTPPSLGNGLHSWYVVAKNAGCDSFSAASAVLVAPAPAVAATPSPADGANVAVGPIDLSWSAPAGQSYDVSLDGVLICAGVGTTGCQPVQISSGSHHWDVVSKTGCGAVQGPSWSLLAQ